MSYADEIKAHAEGLDLRVPEVTIDPADLDRLHEGVSADGRVSAYVSGRLRFDHLTIDTASAPEQLADSVREAVNAAIDAAQGGLGGTGFDADAEARVARFETLLERMDADLDRLDALMDDVERGL